MKRGLYRGAAALLAAAIVVAAAVLIFTPKKEPYLAVAPTSFRIIAQDIPEMAEYSECIVIGTYEGFDSIRNLSRNPENPGEEDPRAAEYYAGHLYHFKVDSVIKGDVPEEKILICHAYSGRARYVESDAVYNDDGTIKKETWRKEYLVDLPDPCYIKPEMGSTYMLFLNHNTVGIDDYYGAVEPFMLKIGGDNTVELQSNLFSESVSQITEEDIRREFKVDGREIVVLDRVTIRPDPVTGLTLEEVLRQIRAAEPREPLTVYAPTYFRAVARDLGEMAAEADYIVLGAYEGLQFQGDFSGVFLGEGEAAREKEGYAAGRVYDFRVRDVLKGSVPGTLIPVLHPYSERRKYTESDAVYNEDGTRTPETWRREYLVDLIDQSYVEPEIGGTYLLFLKYFEREGAGYYRGIVPFMVRLREDGAAELQSNLFAPGAGPEDVLILDQTFWADGREILVWDRVTAYPDWVSGLDSQEVLRQIEAALSAPGT